MGENNRLQSLLQMISHGCVCSARGGNAMPVETIGLP